MSPWALFDTLHSLLLTVDEIVVLLLTADEIVVLLLTAGEIVVLLLTAGEILVHLIIGNWHRDKEASSQICHYTSWCHSEIKIIVKMLLEHLYSIEINKVVPMQLHSEK